MRIQLEGFSDLEKELRRLSKAVGKAALRRSLKKSAEPMADIMRVYVPRGASATDQLAESIAISTKLGKRQSGLHRKMFKDERASVEMFVGPGTDPAGVNQEFGNINHGAQPFVRPAWDEDKFALLDRLGKTLWIEVAKSIQRAERKAARQAGGE